MTIPFIRKLPNGKRKIEQIKRDTTTENLARAFLQRGGRYLIELVPDAENPGSVSTHLMAIIDLANGPEKVSDIVCPNGPDLPEKVDALVRQSIANTPSPIHTPANSNVMALVT